MAHRRWKLWVAGIALAQLLVIGVDVALLWPAPSEAERAAAMIKMGMPMRDFEQARARFPKSVGGGGNLLTDWKLFPDGSSIFVRFSRDVGGWPVELIDTTPAAPVHPLTWLRRKLARILPALAE